MSQVDSPSASIAHFPTTSSTTPAQAQAHIHMVSHPSLAPPTATANYPPPPPLTAAGSSHRSLSHASRSHRHHSHHHRSSRSHAGGSATSYTPQNEFPFFAHTGDVEIVIAVDGLEKRYLLHRLILGQFSGFFEAGMSEEWSRGYGVVVAPPPQQQQGVMTVLGEDGQVVMGDETSGQGQGRPLVRPEQIQAPAVGRKRWRYELDWAGLSGEEEGEEPILVQKPPSGGLFTAAFHPSPATHHPPPPPPPAAPRPRPSTHQSFFRSVANLTLGTNNNAHSPLTPHDPPPPPPTDPALLNPLIATYHNLFLTFYNFPPILSSTNIAAAYSSSKSLLLLADMYDCLSVVGPRIDHHLLRFGSRLFKQIAKYPPSYLKLGYLARSRIIFAEAVVHVVGMWPSAWPYLRTTPDNQDRRTGVAVAGAGYEVPQLVIELIEDKVDELEELKTKIEAKLFRLTLTTSRGERVNPANDYLGWLAMSLFRQWVAENTTPEVRGILKNGAGGGRPGSRQQQQQAPPPPWASSKIYRLIASTNSQAYLPHEELKRFLKCQPAGGSSRDATSLYSKDNLRRFERKVDEVKNLARDVVKPLTRNCLELDLRLLGGGDGGGGGGVVGGLGYLTCVRVEEDELPWD